jgi:hypothetical protein
MDGVADPSTWSAMRISTYSVAPADEGWTSICAATAAKDAPTAPKAGNAHCGASRVSSAVTAGLYPTAAKRVGHARVEQQSTRRANSRSQPAGSRNQRWMNVPNRDHEVQRRAASRRESFIGAPQRESINGRARKLRTDLLLSLNSGGMTV